MKFNRTTITFVILSLGLAGIVYITEIQPDGFNLDRKSEQQDQLARIFTFQPEDIQQITIKTNQQIISFQKQEQSLWQMTQPENAMVSEGTINFLLNLFPQAEKKLAIPVNEQTKKEYGLVQTEKSKSIEIILNNGHNYQIILGSSNFDDTQIYAQVNFPAEIQEESTIFLVSKSFQYAIERDFEEWKKLS